MAMFCPHCGAQTDEADKFCVICGELVHATAVCGVCGESIPISAAFCPTCGTNFLEQPELSLQDPQRLSTHGVVTEPVAMPVEEDAGEEGEEDGGPAPMPGEAEEEPEEDIKDDTPCLTGAGCGSPVRYNGRWGCRKRTEKGTVIQMSYHQKKVGMKLNKLQTRRKRKIMTWT